MSKCIFFWFAAVLTITSTFLGACFAIDYSPLWLLFFGPIGVSSYIYVMCFSFKESQGDY